MYDKCFTQILKEKKRNHLGMKFLKEKLPLIKTMYCLSQINCGAHKHIKGPAWDSTDLSAKN